jgi:hypothetical protein
MTIIFGKTKTDTTENALSSAVLCRSLRLRGGVFYDGTARREERTRKVIKLFPGFLTTYFI